MNTFKITARKNIEVDAIIVVAAGGPGSQGNHPRREGSEHGASSFSLKPGESKTSIWTVRKVARLESGSRISEWFPLSADPEHQERDEEWFLIQREIPDGPKT